MPRNVSRRTLKAMRRDRRAAPSVEALLARWRRETPQERTIREQAETLFQRFASEGLRWSACVQAVKTGWVASLLAKMELQGRQRNEEKMRKRA